jgi:hypothetical protein
MKDTTMLAFIQAALALAPTLIQAGQDITPLAEKLFALFQSGDEPSQQDWDDLHAIEAGQTAVIDADIPGEDDDGA